MSAARPKRAELRRRATVFAALGDETRLALVGKLAGGAPQSISRLAEGSALTRQAITKHLVVLEGAGMVRSTRSGRESLYEFRREPIGEIQSYLEQISLQWDDMLLRLKTQVEKP